MNLSLRDNDLVFIPTFLGNRELSPEKQIKVNLRGFLSRQEATEISLMVGVDMPKAMLMILNHVQSIENLSLDGKLIGSALDLWNLSCSEFNNLVNEITEYIMEGGKVIPQEKKTP